MHNQKWRAQGGFTLVELVVGLTVLAVVALSLTGLFTALVNSAVIAKQKAVASSLATNQMEYLKSLPYDNLAVAGGSIYSSNPIPASTTQKLNGVTYTIKTSINYVDDAYDGCISYPNTATELAECRNFVVHSGAPTNDTNPADYKIAHVSVYNPSNARLAQVDTEISARVAETASTTGAMFITVIDSNGNPVSSATVHVVNAVTGPVDVSDSTDSNGIAIFYGLPPDSANYNYVINASKGSYSTLTTIAPSGVLQPTYSNQKILTQQSSYLTMTIKLQGPNSLLVETTDTNGNALTGVKVYIKGGYKKYTATSDTSYCYDNLTFLACGATGTPTDNRPTTDASGLAGVSNMVPGQYIFCGDNNAASSCKIGNTTYYVAAALPYGGVNPFNPVNVPIYDPANPPSTTYAYGGQNFYQKVRLMLTSNISFPRIFDLTPYDASLSSGTLASFGFTVDGTNLPCSANPASCNTIVKFTQGSNVYTAACTGGSGLVLNCTVNLTGVTAGSLQLSVTANGNTLTVPASPMIGGLSVTP